MGNIQILVQNQPFDRSIALLIFEVDDFGKRRTIGTKVMMKQCKPPCGIAIAPTLKIGEEAGQLLMDGLWDCGIRPSEGTGSAGAMAAAQANLTDLRYVMQQLFESSGDKRKD